MGNLGYAADNSGHYMMGHEYGRKLSDKEIDSIVDELASKLASDDDKGLFKWVVKMKLNKCNSLHEVDSLVRNLFKTRGG